MSEHPIDITAEQYEILRTLVDWARSDVIETGVTLRAPSGAVFGEFRCVTDIPFNATDPKTGDAYAVCPEHVKVHYRLVRPDKGAVLTLMRWAEAGIMDAALVVRAPSGAVVEECRAISNVPREAVDPRTGETFTVSPLRHVEVHHRLAQGAPLTGALALDVARFAVDVEPTTDLRSNVTAFHRAFDLAIGDRPGVPEDREVRLRANLISEEFLETIESLFCKSRLARAALWLVRKLLGLVARRARVRVDFPAFADGLADLMYVAEGGFVAFGIDSRPVHAEVQRSNMAKVGGSRRADGKWLKPSGWTPPDIEGVLRAQGWGECLDPDAEINEVARQVGGVGGFEEVP